MRLALVTEGMIHRSIDDLMDWLDGNAPEVRDLESRDGGLLAPRTFAARAHEPERRRGMRGSQVAASASQPSTCPATRSTRTTPSRAVTTPTCAGPSSSRPSSASTASSPCPAARAPARSRARPRISRPTPGCPTTPASRPGSGENRVRPYWEEINAARRADRARLLVCLELHPGAHVFNVDTFLRLHDAAPQIGVNLDPSHLFWQQMDPLAGHRAAGSADRLRSRQGRPLPRRGAGPQRPARQSLAGRPGAIAGISRPSGTARMTQPGGGRSQPHSSGDTSARSSASSTRTASSPRRWAIAASAGFWRRDALEPRAPA